MKDFTKLFIITFTGLLVALYPFYEIMIRHFEDGYLHADELLFPSLVMVLDGLIIVLALEWYKRKHPEEFRK